MHRFWGLKAGLEAREVGDKLYVFMFEDNSELMRVLRNQPWHHNNSMLLLQNFDGLIAPELMQFHHCFFTVRVYALPMAYMTERIVKVVGMAVGEVLEVEVDHGGRAWGSYVKFKAKIDVNRPLTRSALITLPSGEMEVQFKYERLPDFCFVCGSLLHLESDCNVAAQMKAEKGLITRLYGPELRAEIDEASARFMASRSAKFQALTEQRNPAMTEPIGRTSTTSMGRRRGANDSSTAPESSPNHHAAFMNEERPAKLNKSLPDVTMTSATTAERKHDPLRRDQ